MNAHLTDNVVPINATAAGSAEENTPHDPRLEELLDIFGALDTTGTFEDDKKAILESGISLEDFAELMKEPLFDVIAGREKIDVSVQRLTKTATIPTYMHDSDACADVYADEDIVINSGETAIISTGIALAIPFGYVVHLYPRSSIGAKTGLRLSNSVGVIDSGYKDEIKMIYTNTGIKPYSIKRGDRIGQMCIHPSPMISFTEVEDVKAEGEDRGGGLGSTGA